MRFDVKIGECMTKNVLTLDSEKSVFDAALLLKKHKIGSVIVKHEGAPSGIITERDIVNKLVTEGKNPKEVSLKSVMSSPLITIKDIQTIHDAALSMRKNNVKRLAVMDKEEKLAGIITESDLITIYPGIVDIMAETPHMGQNY